MRPFCHYLTKKRREPAFEAMRIALPHGLSRPLGGECFRIRRTVEQCLEEAFPNFLDAVVSQWERTVKNWVTFTTVLPRITSTDSFLGNAICTDGSPRVPTQNCKAF